MSKVLHFVSGILANASLWGQECDSCLPRPARVTSGQTCVARLGFLDSAGKPSNAVVSNPGERTEIQARILPGPGISSPACKAEVLTIDPNEAEESDSEARAQPSGARQEGIKVHGHWIIDVRNSDGTLATHREFENSLVPTGATALVNSLASTSVAGLWAVQINGALCGGSQYTQLYESAEPSSGPCSYKTLTVSAPRSGPYNGNLVLSGSFTSSASGVASIATTSLAVCPAGVLPARCNITNAPSVSLFTSARFAATTVSSGQFVQVTVLISFM
jgi:hypothetical protein